MANFVYPGTSLETGKAILNEMPSFWIEFFSDTDFTENFAKARGKLFMQTHNNLQELSYAAGKDAIPVYHTAKWQEFKIRNSNKTDNALMEFGVGNTYGVQAGTTTTFQYGTTISTAVGFLLPDAVKDIPMLMDQTENAAVVYFKNINYLITASGYIIFKDDPFVDPLISRTAIMDANGNQTDTEITLWMFRPSIDVDWIWKQFGYVLGIRYDSSENYRDFVSAIWDAVTGGTAREQIDKALSALTDIPLTKSDGEVVQYVDFDHDYRLIITDKYVYKFNPLASVLVNVGNTVNTGSALITALRYYEFHNSTVPAEIPQITVPASYFTVSLTDSLIFPNVSSATTVTTDSGYTRLQFTINGASADTTLFWNTVHTNGIAAGATLAQLLDTRISKVGEPDASVLPTAINPASFLVSNLFGNNLFLVTMKLAHFGRNAIGLDALKHFRKIIPAHKSMLPLIDYTLPYGTSWVLDFSVPTDAAYESVI